MKINSTGFTYYTVSKENEEDYGRFRNCCWWGKDLLNHFHKTIGTEVPETFAKLKKHLLE